MQLQQRWYKIDFEKVIAVVAAIIGKKCNYKNKTKHNRWCGNLRKNKEKELKLMLLVKIIAFTLK